MRKDITDYNVFLREYIYKKFGPIDESVLKKDLGIDDKTYCLAIKNKKELSKKTQKEVDRFISEIKMMVNNEIILRQLLGRISFICTYGNVVIEDKNLTGQFGDGKNNYCSELDISNNRISSYVTNNNNFSNIIYTKSLEEDSVTYQNKINRQFQLDDVYKTYFDAFSNTIIKNYNKNGRQVFEFKEEMRNCYSRDELTGMTSMIDPFFFENYYTKNCMWRVGDFVLSTDYVKYTASGDKDFKYLIGVDDCCDNDELICPRDIFNVSEDDVSLYTAGEISTMQLWERTKVKYKKIVNIL